MGHAEPNGCREGQVIVLFLWAVGPGPGSAPTTSKYSTKK